MPDGLAGRRPARPATPASACAEEAPPPTADTDAQPAAGWVRSVARAGGLLAVVAAILGALYLWQRWGALVALDGFVSYCF